VNFFEKLGKRELFPHFRGIFLSKIDLVCEGDLNVKCIHENGASFLADAPKAVGGKGECFSPTDLLPTALGSCMLITMKLKAKKLGIDLMETKATVEKEMSSAPPRKINSITVSIKSIFKPTPEEKKELENAALTCPVNYSLDPNIKKNTIFFWGE
jgi:putative redox protein